MVTNTAVHHGQESVTQVKLMMSVGVAGTEREPNTVSIRNTIGTEIVVSRRGLVPSGTGTQGPVFVCVIFLT